MKSLTSDINLIYKCLYEKDESIFLSISDDILSNPTYVMKMMNDFPRFSQQLYAFIPQHLKLKEEIVDLALPYIAKTMKINVLPTEVRNNEKYMIKLVEVNLLMYDYLDDGLKNKIGFNLGCLHINNFLDVKIPGSIWHNYLFIEAAAKAEKDYVKFKHIAMGKIFDDEIRNYIKPLFEQTNSAAEFCALLLSKKLEATLEDKQYIKKIKI